MKYVFPVSLTVALLIVGGTYFALHHTPAANSPVASIVPTQEAATTSAPTSPTRAPAGYTKAQVAAHANATSCWTSISGNVYDLTSWINQHPGGSGPILSLCGTDGTAAFMAQHGGQGRPAAELKQFLLGPLQ